MRLTVWAVLVASSALAQETKEISLLVGTQRVVDAPGLKRIAVADTSIADVKLIGNSQMLVIGAGEGKTTLLSLTAGGERVNYLITVRRGVPEITDPTFENGITVEKGQRATYKATGITAIEVVDPTVLAAKLTGGKLTVTGKASGNSELVLSRGKLTNLRMPVEVLGEAATESSLGGTVDSAVKELTLHGRTAGQVMLQLTIAGNPQALNVRVLP